MFKSLYQIITCAAIAAPCLLSAGSSHHFHLKDFEGRFVAYGYSVGGVALAGDPLGGSLTQLAGTSSVNLTQSRIDKNGNGVINVASLKVWSPAPGIPGVPGISIVVSPNIDTAASSALNPIDQYFNQPANIRFKVILRDPENGAGVIQVNDFPYPGSRNAQDFIAYKQDGCKVNKWVSNSLSGVLFDGYVTDPSISANITFTERQD